MKNLVVLLALGILLTTACNKNELPKYVALGDLRILAMTLNTPEVNPGATVTVTPYVSDPGSSGTITYSWIACVDPGVSQGATISCDGNPTATTLTTGTMSTLMSTNSYTDNADAFTVTVPATILASRSTKDIYNGVSYLVLYTVHDGNGATVQGLKRITVTDPSKTSKNQNPSITAVLEGATPVTSLAPGTDHTLNVTYGAGSREAYSQQKDDGSFQAMTEDMQVTWFYTDGETKYYRTLNDDANVFTAPASYVTTRPAFLVVVVHDGRGGTAVMKVHANP